MNEKAMPEERTTKDERATDRESTTVCERTGAPSGAPLTKLEARYLVDSYYTVQEYRKTAANQLRAATPENEQPSEILQGFLTEYEKLENAMKRELERFAKSS